MAKPVNATTTGTVKDTAGVIHGLVVLGTVSTPSITLRNGTTSTHPIIYTSTTLGYSEVVNFVEPGIDFTALHATIGGTLSVNLLIE